MNMDTAACFTSAGLSLRKVQQDLLRPLAWALMSKTSWRYSAPKQVWVKR
jgi:hypothetical protein